MPAGHLHETGPSGPGGQSTIGSRPPRATCQRYTPRIATLGARMRFVRLAPAVLVMLCALSATVPAAHATAARALVDPVIGGETAAQQTAHMTDIGRLRARYVRLELNWARAE